MAAIGGFPGQSNAHELSVYLGACMSEQPKTERVPMSDLRAGDVVWTHGLRVRLVRRFESAPAGSGSWDGEILNGLNPYPRHADDRQWTVQSVDYVKWDREV